MNKQDRFLLLTQTAILANGINLTLEENAKSLRSDFSAAGALNLMEEALRAADLIPEDLSAEEAAWEFCGWMLESMREPESVLPHWFARS